MPVVSCTICGQRLTGWPDADVTCGPCEVLNFAGDALRHPPRQAAHPQPWWLQARLPLAPMAPRRDGVRALRASDGTWTWADEGGEGVPDAS